MRVNVPSAARITRREEHIVIAIIRVSEHIGSPSRPPTPSRVTERSGRTPCVSGYVCHHTDGAFCGAHREHRSYRGFCFNRVTLHEYSDYSRSNLLMRHARRAAGPLRMCR